MPLVKKRKHMGFVGTPAWKKRKVGESSLLLLQYHVGRVLLSSSTAMHQNKLVTAAVPLTGRLLLMKKWIVIVKMILNMRWKIAITNLTVEQVTKIVTQKSHWI